MLGVFFHSDKVFFLEVRVDLTVEGETHITITLRALMLQNLHHDLLGRGNDEGFLAEGVGINGREKQRFYRRMENRTAG